MFFSAPFLTLEDNRSWKVRRGGPKILVVTAPESQLLDLTSTCRHITVLDEVDVCCVICKPQMFNRGVCRGAVICEVGSSGGEDTYLGGSSADGTGIGCEFFQNFEVHKQDPHKSLICPDVAGCSFV